MFIVRENYIKKLIRLVEESDIESLEVSTWGRKVKITHSSKNSTNGSGHGHSVVHTIANPNPSPIPAVAESVPSAPAQAAPAVVDNGKLVTIKSPMVGTFYSAPSPDAEPYVSVNQKVTTGQVVCIVEAMKLMNEIESEFSGRVTSILVENGKPVEFGQELYKIELE